MKTSTQQPRKRWPFSGYHLPELRRQSSTRRCGWTGCIVSPHLCALAVPPTLRHFLSTDEQPEQYTIPGLCQAIVERTISDQDLQPVLTARSRRIAHDISNSAVHTSQQYRGKSFYDTAVSTWLQLHGPRTTIELLKQACQILGAHTTAARWNGTDLRGLVPPVQLVIRRALLHSPCPPLLPLGQQDSCYHPEPSGAYLYVQAWIDDLAVDPISCPSSGDVSTFFVRFGCWTKIWRRAGLSRQITPPRSASSPTRFISSLILRPTSRCPPSCNSSVTSADF